MGEITSLISTIFDEPGNPNIGLFIAAIMFVFLAHLISQFINYHFDTDWQKNLIAEVELIKKLDEINFDDSNKTDCKEKLLTHIIEEVNRKTILMQSKIDRINRFPLAYSTLIGFCIFSLVECASGRVFDTTDLILLAVVFIILLVMAFFLDSVFHLCGKVLLPRVRNTITWIMSRYNEIQLRK